MPIEAQGLKAVVDYFKNMDKQVNFATAVAITRSAALARTDIYGAMLQVFDRPTPYTLKSLYSTKATRDKLQAYILYRRTEGGQTSAEDYLGPQVYGGGRKQRKFEKAVMAKAGGSAATRSFIVPTAFTRLDAYGNISRGLIVQIMSRLGVLSNKRLNASKSKRSQRQQRRVNFFIMLGKGRGEPIGVWERRPGTAKPVMFFIPNAQYRRILPFFEVGQSTINTELVAQFKKALAEAERTAR